MAGGREGRGRRGREGGEEGEKGRVAPLSEILNTPLVHYVHSGERYKVFG